MEAPPAIPPGTLDINGSLQNGEKEVINNNKFKCDPDHAKLNGACQALMEALNDAPPGMALGVARLLKLVDDDALAKDALVALHKFTSKGAVLSREPGIRVKSATAQLLAWKAEMGADHPEVVAALAKDVNPMREVMGLDELTPTAASAGAGFSAAETSSWPALRHAVAQLITSGGGGVVFGVEVPPAAGRDAAAHLVTARAVMRAWCLPFQAPKALIGTMAALKAAPEATLADCSPALVATIKAGWASTAATLGMLEPDEARVAVDKAIAACGVGGTVAKINKALLGAIPSGGGGGGGGDSDDEGLPSTRKVLAVLAKSSVEAEKRAAAEAARRAEEPDARTLASGTVRAAAAQAVATGGGFADAADAEKQWPLEDAAARAAQCTTGIQRITPGGHGRISLAELLRSTPEHAHAPLLSKSLASAPSTTLLSYLDGLVNAACVEGEVPYVLLTGLEGTVLAARARNMLGGALPTTPQELSALVAPYRDKAAATDYKIRVAYALGGGERGSQAALVQFGLRAVERVATAMTDEPSLRDIGAAEPDFDAVVGRDFTRMVRFLLEAIAHGGVLVLQPTKLVGEWYTKRTRDDDNEAWGRRPACTLAAMSAQAARGGAPARAVAPKIGAVRVVPPQAVGVVAAIEARLPAGTALPAVLTWKGYEGKALSAAERNCWCCGKPVGACAKPVHACGTRGGLRVCDLKGVTTFDDAVTAAKLSPLYRA